MRADEADDDSAEYPLRRDDLKSREVDGEVLILDRRSNRIHQLNQTAGLVWSLCDGEHDVAGIATELIERFGAEREVAARDAARTVQELRDLGLFESE